MRKQFKALIQENRWLKGIPTTLTICNSLCGFGAILYTLNAYTVNPDIIPDILTLSAYIVLAAMLFDALDGFAARIFNAASMHGMQMDSLADMVTFGVAPAVIVAVMAHSLRKLEGNSYYFVWLMCAVYLGCAALRLATYNVHAMLEKKSSDKFNGLPSPGAAAAICSLVIFFNYYEEHKIIIKILPIYACVLGLLMVSHIKYQHMAKWLQSVKRNNSRLLCLIIFLGLLAWHPIIMLTVAINAYVLAGPVSAFLKIFKRPAVLQPEVDLTNAG
jgi:CDP-diacylglycerol--serine O-phosphatidyltransferase